jgi:arylsulfatase A-like enzyme
MPFMKSLLLCLLLPFAALAASQTRPNIVLILADDLGYGDLGCFGSKTCRTPHLDALAAQGTRYTSFYVAQAVCTASRAALMTGCYPNRIGLQGALNHTSPTGIHPQELLLPEMLRAAGYATAAYGKWHLGTRPEFHPMRHGFDEFFGIPYSNDNSKFHPTVKGMPPLPLYEGETVKEEDADQALFTQRITDHAVDFISRKQAQPFFLYVPHVMPHVPIFVSKDYAGRSGAGLYADVISELDAGIGRILHALDEHGLRENTLVIFFSDNGPFLSYGDHAGSAGPLREGKLTCYEGGVRVPCILRWPGHLPAGQVNDSPWMATDLLPTLAALTGQTLPTSRVLDGQDVSSLWEGKPQPERALFFYAGEELQAVRRGQWKLHFPHPYLTVNGPAGRNGKPANFEHMKPESIEVSGIQGIASRHGYRVEQQSLALYDLSTDVAEQHDLAQKHPEIVWELSQLAQPIREQLGDKLTNTRGKANRPVGRVAD